MFKINSFDIDGVIFMGDFGGVYPGPDDVIITGRSYEEEPETLAMLSRKGITNRVFFNPLPFAAKTRETSGQHKAKTLLDLRAMGYPIAIHYEDDPVQIAEIKERVPDIIVVQLVHDLVEKENVRHR